MENSVPQSHYDVQMLSSHMWLVASLRQFGFVHFHSCGRLFPLLF